VTKKALSATIIGTADTESMTRGRDNKVIGHDGNLINIQEIVGYYDLLQYPLLFLFGTYG